jgi:hypothetical protein
MNPNPHRRKLVLRQLVRRPSPAMLVALLALFVSMGGVSYGVATGFIDSREIKNNTVRTKDLRNNDIRTRDIRNNEVRGVDIRNSTVQGRDVALNTLTGSDINETRLGKVPSATAADRATSANTATSAASVDVLKTIAPVTVNEGDAPATLLTHGPFTIRGACTADMAGTNASVAVTSTEPGSSASEVALPGSSAGASAGVPVEGSAPSGRAVVGVFGLGADTDAGPGNAGACTFHGYVVLTG